MAELLDRLDRDGVFARRLEVAFASHCFHMDPLLDDFATRIDGLVANDGDVPFVSTVDGEARAGHTLDAHYWVRNLRAPVAFEPAVGHAVDAGATTFLEVSPHASLSRAVAEIAGARGRSATCVGTLMRDQPGRRCVLSSAAALHVTGVSVDFETLTPDGRFVRTPLYPYQRERYWFGERTRADVRRPSHPLIETRTDDTLDPRRTCWQGVLDVDAAPYAADYRVDGEPTVPWGLYVELALAAAADAWPTACSARAGPAHPRAAGPRRKAVDRDPARTRARGRGGRAFPRPHPNARR